VRTVRSGNLVGDRFFCLSNLAHFTLGSGDGPSQSTGLNIPDVWLRTLSEMILRKLQISNRNLYEYSPASPKRGRQSPGLVTYLPRYNLLQFSKYQMALPRRAFADEINIANPSLRLVQCSLLQIPYYLAGNSSRDLQPFPLPPSSQDAISRKCSRQVR